MMPGWGCGPMVDLSNLSIVFVAGTLGQGGAERQLFYQLRSLKQSGAKLRVFCLTSGEYWEKPLRELGVQTVWFGQHPNRLARLIRLISELRDEDPVIIQSLHLYTNIYAALSARLFGLREIGGIRNDIIREMQASGRIMGNLSVRLPRAITVNSETAMRKAIEIGLPPGRLHLLRNVVDIDHFTPIDRSTSCFDNRPVKIAAIGRLAKQKRFDRMLSVIAQMRAQTDRPFEVMIAGTGPLRSQLDEQVLTLGLQTTVQFRDMIGDPRVLYREADILVLTSDWEGTPNVVLEAMACGLPVVATNVGDVPQLLREDVTGFLAPPEDKEKLVAALLKLLHDPDLRREIGRRAREYVAAEHSPQRLPQRLFDLYETVLA